MDKIFTVTTVSARPSARAFRCVGWFSNFEEASINVKLNCGDIHEGIKSFVVIEEVGQGFYSACLAIQTWFWWNEDFKQYEKCDKPSAFKSICGFGMG